MASFIIENIDRARALAAGFDHHLTKPVDIEETLRLIAAHAGAGA